MIYPLAYQVIINSSDHSRESHHLSQYCNDPAGVACNKEGLND